MTFHLKPWHMDDLTPVELAAYQSVPPEQSG